MEVVNNITCTPRFGTHFIIIALSKSTNFQEYICVEFLSHNVIRLQLAEIGILFMLSFLDD